MRQVATHLPIKPVVHNKLVRHLDPEGFHWVLLSVVKAANFVVIEVRYSRHILSLSNSEAQEFI